MIDPLLGENQPTEEEYRAARRWARRRAVIMMVASWATGSTVTWLAFHEVLTFEALVFVVPMWLCTPIWARQRIARDKGLPTPRLY